MNTMLKLNGISKNYKKFKLDNVSFELPRGYIMGLIGPNGAGKSTIMKIIMNIIEKDSGEVKVDGLNLDNNLIKIRNKIGYVSEEQYFYEDMTVAWIEKFVSKFYDNWNTKMFNDLILKNKVDKKKKVKELSKGMKVILSIALALAHEPELLILDEPTSGLDPVIRREIQDILLHFIQDDNKSILISSHITEDLENIADYVTYIVDGKIVISDEKEELLSTWKKVNVKKDIINDGIRTKLILTNENAFSLCGYTNNYKEIATILNKHIEDGSVIIEDVKLDDILISLVKEESIC